MTSLTSSSIASHPAVAKVKAVLGVHHSFLDQWFLNFLENKSFDIDETLLKLDRRRRMEYDEFANYVVTPSMRVSMSSGVLQLLPGPDKKGYPVVYIVTCRDHPTAEQRDERRKNMDMWLTYVTRITSDNVSCQVTWLINQKDSSLWSNTDLTFQREMMTRIAKYFPGAQHRVYVCNMSNSLSFVLKPLIKAAPASIRDSVVLMSERDVRDRKLLQFFDRHVLPVALGGDYNGDHGGSWTLFGSQVADYTARVVAMLRSTRRDELSMGIKEWEVREAFRVDKSGNSVPTKSDEGRLETVSRRSDRASGDDDSRDRTDEAPQEAVHAHSSTDTNGARRSPVIDPSLAALNDDELPMPAPEHSGDHGNTKGSSVTSGNTTERVPMGEEPQSALHFQTISWLTVGAACRFRGRVLRVHQLLDQCLYLALHGPALAHLFHSATSPIMYREASTGLGDRLFLFGGSSGRCLLPAHHRVALVSTLPRMLSLALHLLFLFRAACEHLSTKLDDKQGTESCANVSGLSSHNVSLDALGLLDVTLPSPPDAHPCSSSPCTAGLLEPLSGSTSCTGTILWSTVDVERLVRRRCEYLKNLNATTPSTAACPSKLRCSPDMLLDAVHLSAARALDSLSSVRASLHFLRVVGDKVLRIWHAKVSRAVLLCEVRQKLEHLWADQLCAMCDAYEDHQAALCVLQFVLAQRGGSGSADSAAALLGLRQGFCNRLFVEVHHAVLKKRRCERSSFLFHLFPPAHSNEAKLHNGSQKDKRPATVSERLRAWWFSSGSSAAARTELPPGDSCSYEDCEPRLLSRHRPTLDALHHAWCVRHVGWPATPVFAAARGAAMSTEREDGVAHRAEGRASGSNLSSLLQDMERLERLHDSVMESVFAVQRRLCEGRYHVQHLLHRYLNIANGLSAGEADAVHSLLKEVVVMNLEASSGGNQMNDDSVSMDALISAEVTSLTRLVDRMEYPVREYLFALAAERFLELVDDALCSPAALQEWLWSLDRVLGDAWDHQFAGSVEALVAISETSMRLHDMLSRCSSSSASSSLQLSDVAMPPPSADFLEVAESSADQMCQVLEGAVSVLILASGFTSLWDDSPALRVPLPLSSTGARCATTGPSFRTAREGVCANSVVGQFLFALERVSDALVNVRELSLLQEASL